MTSRRTRRAVLGAATVEMERAIVDAAAARTEVACAVAGLRAVLDDTDQEPDGDRRRDQ